MKATAARAAGPRFPVLRFLLRFALLLGAYQVLVLLPRADRMLYGYLRANAWGANAILRFLGQDTRLHEVTIRAADFAISVRRGCDALEPAWIYAAALLAFPAPWRTKPRALLLGVAAILALNLVRIVSLFFIGRNWPEFFPSAHLELWPAAFILAALGLWLAWLRTGPLRGQLHGNGPSA